MKFVSSSEDEGVSFTPKKKNAKKRVLVRASNDSESNESEVEDVGSAKKRRLKRLSDLARRKNPNFKQLILQGNESDSSEEKEEIDGPNVNDDSNIRREEKPMDFEVTTKSFRAKYSGKCCLEVCQEVFVVGVTDIVGCKLLSKSTGLYELNIRGGREVPFWICAGHAVHYVESSGSDDTAEEEGSDESEEEEGSDDSFVVSEGPMTRGQDAMTDDAREALNDQLTFLRRDREMDRANKDSYFESQSQYQLQIHTPTNPGLYVSPEKRYQRNMKMAAFDMGLKEERQIGRGDPQYKESFEIKVFGQRIKVFASTETTARHEGECELKKCGQEFEVGDPIVGTMLHRRNKNTFELNKLTGKYYWICASHISSRKNLVESSSNGDEEVDSPYSDSD